MRLIHLSKKGQEEAPIELLIGVAILAFVLVIGFYTYENSCSAQSEQKFRASLSYFARELESVYQGSVGTKKTITVDFTQEGCSNMKLESIRLFDANSQTCLNAFGRDSCLMFALQLSDQTTGGGSVINTPLVEPVNIPSEAIDVRLIKSDTGDEICVFNELDSQTVIGSTALDCKFTLGKYSVLIEKISNSQIDVSLK